MCEGDGDCPLGEYCDGSSGTGMYLNSVGQDNNYCESTYVPPINSNTGGTTTTTAITTTTTTTRTTTTTTALIPTVTDCTQIAPVNPGAYLASNGDLFTVECGTYWQ